jgi:hypothetical protein
LRLSLGHEWLMISPIMGVCYRGNGKAKESEMRGASDRERERDFPYIDTV